MRKFLLLIWLLFPFLSLFGQSESGVKVNLAGNTGKEVTISPLEVNVFPNPVPDKRFTIELNNHTIQEIRISNIAGIQVYNKKFNTPVNRFEVEIDNLPNGIYLLRVNADSNTSKTLKLLVSNQQ